MMISRLIVRQARRTGQGYSNERPFPRRWGSGGGFVASLLLLGFALRLSLAYPTHSLPAEADSVVAGIAALEILAGELPVFNVGFRNGAIGSYLAAPLFWLFGASRATLVLTPLIVGTATMLLWFLFLRALLDRISALLALVLIAVPAPPFLFWTSMPNTYPETLLLCVAVLWLTTLAAASPRVPWRDFGVGLAAGLGFWSSPLTLSCTLPAGLWLVLRDPSRLLRGRQVSAGILGAGLGALPWLLYNLGHGFPSLHRTFATQSVAGLDALFANLHGLLTYKLPSLLANTDTGVRPSAADRLSWLEAPILALHLAAAGVCVWLVVRSRRDSAVEPTGADRCEGFRGAAALFFLVAAMTVLLNLVSAAGLMPGPTARYLLPLYLVVPGVLGVFLRRLATRSRAAAAIVLATLVVFHLMGSYLPWTKERQTKRAQVAREDQLIEVLDRAGVEAVIGDYWTVYPINFHSEMRILGVPLRPANDFRLVAQKLGPGEKRLAVVTHGSERRDFRSWLPGADLAGRWIEAPRGFGVFLVEETGDAPELVRRLRAAARDP